MFVKGILTQPFVINKREVITKAKRKCCNIACHKSIPKGTKLIEYLCTGMLNKINSGMCYRHFCKECERAIAPQFEVHDLMNPFSECIPDKNKKKINWKRRLDSLLKLHENFVDDGHVISIDEEYAHSVYITYYDKFVNLLKEK